MAENKKKEQPCIRCAECVNRCPVGINPVFLMTTMKAMPVDKAKIKALDPLKCTDCGICTQVCPSGIDLATIVKRSKIIAKLP